MSEIERFLEAQENDYDKALKEIKDGKKSSCWMWYIFPQIIGLGMTEINKKYSIKNIEEGKEYLENELLRGRLIEISQALLDLNDADIHEVMGFDDVKLKSSMTLFKKVEEIFNIDCGNIFQKVLDKYFKGEEDNKTLNILEKQKLEKEGINIHIQQNTDNNNDEDDEDKKEIIKNQNDNQNENNNNSNDNIEKEEINKPEQMIKNDINIININEIGSKEEFSTEEQPKKEEEIKDNNQEKNEDNQMRNNEESGGIQIEQKNEIILNDNEENIINNLQDNPNEIQEKVEDNFMMIKEENNNLMNQEEEQNSINNSNNNLNSDKNFNNILSKKKSIHFSLPSRSQLKSMDSNPNDKNDIQMTMNNNQDTDNSRFVIIPFDEEKKCCPIDCNIF